MKSGVQVGRQLIIQSLIPITQVMMKEQERMLGRQKLSLSRSIKEKDLCPHQQRLRRQMLRIRG